jgi:hypothetical protein
MHNTAGYDPERDLQIDECESWLALSTGIEWSWQPLDTEPTASEDLQGTSSQLSSTSSGPSAPRLKPSGSVTDTRPPSYLLPDSYH